LQTDPGARRVSTVEDDGMDANLATVREELSGEHRDIEALTGQLAGAGGREATPILDRLHEVLLRHFAHEEYPGGFYDALGACSPAVRDELRVLVDQHFLIVSKLQSLRERARRPDEAAHPSFGADMAGLSTLLSEHERREMEMVARLSTR
jgi:hypothetical protein